MIEALVNHWILYTVLALGVWCFFSFAVVSVYAYGVKVGQTKERVSTARAMATIRKHYAVPCPPKGAPVLTRKGAEKLFKQFDPTDAFCNEEGTITCADGKKVTYAEWCELVGTTTGDMAAAQEMAEAEEWENDPIGRCPDCGTPVYTVPGYCARCNPVHGS